MIEVLVFLLTVAAIVAALIFLRRLQVRRYDRQAVFLSDELGTDIPPWDKGTEHVEPGVPHQKV